MAATRQITHTEVLELGALIREQRKDNLKTQRLAAARSQDSRSLARSRAAGARTKQGPAMGVIRLTSGGAPGLGRRS